MILGVHGVAADNSKKNPSFLSHISLNFLRFMLQVHFGTLFWYKNGCEKFNLAWIYGQQFSADSYFPTSKIIFPPKKAENTQRVA